MRLFSLEGLPFPPQVFDYVRIAGIGLGVPEDEVSSSIIPAVLLTDGRAVAISPGGIYNGLLFAFYSHLHPPFRKFIVL